MGTECNCDKDSNGTLVCPVHTVTMTEVKTCRKHGTGLSLDACPYCENKALKAEGLQLHRELEHTKVVAGKAEAEQERLSEANSAMEKMLSRVGDVLGVKDGDVDDLLEKLEALNHKERGK